MRNEIPAWETTASPEVKSCSPGRTRLHSDFSAWPKTIPEVLQVFAWSFPLQPTANAYRTVALAVIEKGRAWHWGLIPHEWIDIPFIIRHGQLKTKQAFIFFHPELNSRTRNCELD